MYRKLAALSVTVLVASFIVPDYTINIIGTIIRNSLFLNKRFSKTPANIFTKEELKFYNGVDKPQLYLSILGEIFDVTRGARHYGPNQQYHVFVGCDASRNFVTGKFEDRDISEEVADLKKDELRSLHHWIKFYKKEYGLVGKLIGKYYDENGKLTPYGKEVKKLIKNAERDKESEKEVFKQYPPCNVEWDAETGTRMWCSEKSGGISRDWVGVPRQLYEVDSKNYRCACINEEQVHDLGNIKEYEDCDKKSSSCFVKK